jgi:hypothetical protein
MPLRAGGLLQSGFCMVPLLRAGLCVHVSADQTCVYAGNHVTPLLTCGLCMGFCIWASALERCGLQERRVYGILNRLFANRSPTFSTF